MSRSAHINTVPGLGPIDVPDANLVAGFQLNFDGTNWVATPTPVVVDGGGPTLGGGKGKIKLNDEAIDVVEVHTAFLRIQQQDDDFNIVNTTELGRVEFYGDDDTASADEVGGSISVTATDTWIDGDESARMELSVTDDTGTLNNDQVVLNSDGTTSVSTLSSANNLQGVPQHMKPNIFDPLAVQGADTQVCFWLETDADLTITNIKITLDAAGNEVAGDLMYADAFIGFANPVVINICDTTSGVIDDSAMGTAAVPAGKCIYFQFDSAPHDDITQMSWDVTWDYD